MGSEAAREQLASEIEAVLIQTFNFINSSINILLITILCIGYFNFVSGVILLLLLVNVLLLLSKIVSFIVFWPSSTWNSILLLFISIRGYSLWEL
mgnify:CR=1 FL=1